MDSQHKKIKGYRDLTQEEIDAMNAIKKKGDELGAFLRELWEIEGIDKRWASIGETHLQQGIMALVRSVAKPDSF